jgi:hypothetical protein
MKSYFTGTQPNFTGTQPNFPGTQPNFTGTQPNFTRTQPNFIPLKYKSWSTEKTVEFTDPKRLIQSHMTFVCRPAIFFSYAKDADTTLTLTAETVNYCKFRPSLTLRSVTLHLSLP